MSKKRKKLSAKQEAALEQLKAMCGGAGNCFRCDGTGQLCNVCGESQRACGCAEGEQSFYDCPDCKGKGK